VASGQWPVKSWRPVQWRPYTYDFGDNREHSLVVEKILTAEPGVIYPVCTDGQLQGPPEDSGGAEGFYYFLEAIRDPDHDQHEEMLEWAGGSFDAESFSLSAVNERLQRKFREGGKNEAHGVAH
jgi:Plasmid pRiA4b ORF-3-like protein